MTQPACRACASTNVIPDAVVNDHNSSTAPFPLGVTAKRASPESVEFLGLSATAAAMTVPLAARVCADCGAVDLYAPDAASLWAAYRG